MTVFSGHLSKMKAALGDSPGEAVHYHLRLDDELTPLNPLIGKTVKLEHTGQIHCTECGRKTNKSFSQGFCYPCFTKLAQCDSCIMSPEKCHFHLGTCREPEWAESHCMVDHIVYLANSSGVKVGITRGNQVPTRWIDQGATQAMPLFRVKSRYQSGLLEDALRQHVADKTSWQAMLKGNALPVDLAEVGESLKAKIAEPLANLQNQFGVQAIQPLAAETLEINYPVLEFPTKVKSFNLDKSPVAEGTLMGIKGQYLIMDTGVINLRKYTAYHVEFSHG